MKILDRLFDRLKVELKQVTYGNIILLIGQRGTGKSETIKTLCKSISGQKYIVRFNENLSPLSMHVDDKKIYENLPGCIVIEKDENIDWQPGVFIMEDFPSLNKSARRELYNQIKDARHTQMNFIIVAHDFKVLKDTVLDHANNILIYKDAAIKPQQLGPRINGLKNGYAVERAKNNLQDYHYLFISFDDKKWHNPTINSRDVDLLTKAVRGNLKASELSDIYYPKKAKNKISTPQRDCKAEILDPLLQIGLSTDEICSALNTTPGFIWKEKVNIKKRYETLYGKNNLKGYLKDCRRNT